MLIHAEANRLCLVPVLFATLLQHTALYCTPLYCTGLYSTVLNCTVLHFTALNCIVLTVLHCTVLHWHALYCTVLYSSPSLHWAIGRGQGLKPCSIDAKMCIDAKTCIDARNCTIHKLIWAKYNEAKGLFSKLIVKVDYRMLPFTYIWK